MAAHTWQRFNEARCIDEIILVVRDGMQSAFAERASRFNFRKSHRFVTGGAERQDSVWRGLEALSPATEIVAIQDAARPCTTVDAAVGFIEQSAHFEKTNPGV